MNVNALAHLLKRGDIGTVVATAGTTGTGSVDPIGEILKLKERYGFRFHIDAAYGGYYILARNLREETRKSLGLLSEADSVVIDPHKHGLQPYGCGCVLFRDPAVGALYKHDSPYTYFSSTELHLGEISLECSRPGAAAVALWATQRLLPMTRGGDFAAGLERSREAALQLHSRLRNDHRFLTFLDPELDIEVWAPLAGRVSEVSRRSREMFTRAAARNLHLALFSYPTRLLGEAAGELEVDEEQITCLRSCLMKPEHLDWIDRIWQILQYTAEEIS